jgi:putative endonuclease
VQTTPLGLNTIGTRRDPRVTRSRLASSGVGSDARHDLGALGERLAGEHLTRRGFEIVERNFRTRFGELDIVAFDGRTLAFVEVKTRRLSPGRGSPFDAIRTLKQRQVRRMAAVWLSDRRDRPYAQELRFEALGVTFDLSGELIGLEHLEGAF